MSESESTSEEAHAPRKMQKIAKAIGIATIATLGILGGKEVAQELFHTEVDESGTGYGENINRSKENHQTILEWEKQAIHKLNGSEQLAPGEQSLSNGEITQGTYRWQVMKYQKNLGVASLTYPGLLPDGSSPAPTILIPAGYKVEKYIILQGKNMISPDTREEVDYKYAYFLCDKKQLDNIKFLDKKTEDIQIPPEVCVVPLDNLSPVDEITK